jgi:hypothetical protein
MELTWKYNFNTVNLNKSVCGLGVFGSALEKMMNSARRNGHLDSITGRGFNI